MNAFLDKIMAEAREHVHTLRGVASFDTLLGENPPRERRLFAAALRADPPSIIAEIKKASPSKGEFRSDFDPMSLAETFSRGGAAALSVVTEPGFFRGDGAWIEAIGSRVDLPIIRKDFIIDPIQIAESAVLGADAILLIARILTVTQLRELQDAATRAELDVLFEAHDETDLEKISQCQPTIVGINARNLDTFQVDTGQFARLVPLIPSGAIRVAESGINAATQISQLTTLGYSAFLIGETLVRSADPAATIRHLRGDGRTS